MKSQSILALSLLSCVNAIPIGMSDVTENPFAGALFGNESLSRPLIHLTPDYGWMNDPNGLWYDAKDDIWHAYYQYNPADRFWDLPLYWGHAVSKDLLTWDNVGLAIYPLANNSGAYSGSMVIDYNNTSGFFDDSIDPAQRCIAVWTYNTPDSETQYISYSLDGGYTFVDYAENPVLEMNSTQFRDPKVFWYEPTQKWIMTVAKAQEYAIGIYSSPDMKHWTHESDFAREGYIGYQYECPGIVPFPVDALDIVETGLPADKKEVWALFLAVNPGSPQGGSSYQYFMGDFNGTHFNPYWHNTNLMDFGRDYYAQQTYFNTPSGDVYAMGWGSNWQYCAYVPTDPWRSSETLVRKYTAMTYQSNPQTKIIQLRVEPVIDYNALELDLASAQGSNIIPKVDDPVSFDLSKGSNGLVEFNMTWSVNTTAYNNSNFADLSVYFKGHQDPTEYFRFGFVANVPSAYIVRDATKVNFVHYNPFFSDKVSIDLQPVQGVNETVNYYNVRGIIDRDIAELFFNDGAQAFTNTFFLSGGNYIGSIDIEVTRDDVFQVVDFSARQMYPKNATIS